MVKITYTHFYCIFIVFIIILFYLFCSLDFVYVFDRATYGQSYLHPIVALSLHSSNTMLYIHTLAEPTHTCNMISVIS